MRCILKKGDFGGTLTLTPYTLELVQKWAEADFTKQSLEWDAKLSRAEL